MFAWTACNPDLLRPTCNSLLLCFGLFPTLYMKISCMKNSLEFLKTGLCNKIKKTNFAYAITHHRALQCFPINRQIVK